MKTNSYSAVSTVHRLLFQALLEIRAQGHECSNKVVFHLADLFHNVALELENAAEGRCSYEDVLKFLEERAREKGLARWLEHTLTTLGQE